MNLADWRDKASIVVVLLALLCFQEQVQAEGGQEEMEGGEEGLLCARGKPSFNVSETTSNSIEIEIENGGLEDIPDVELLVNYHIRGNENTKQKRYTLSELYSRGNKINLDFLHPKSNYFICAECIEDLKTKTTATSWCNTVQTLRAQVEISSIDAGDAYSLEVKITVGCISGVLGLGIGIGIYTFRNCERKPQKFRLASQTV